MMSEGADSRASQWTARRWDAIRRLHNRTSLRTKLVTALLALVAVALVVISVVGVTFLRTYLLGQVDTQLRSAQQAAEDVVVNDDVRVAQNLAIDGYAVWWLPEGGAAQQVVQPSSAPYSGLPPGDVPPSTLPSSAQSQLAANPYLTTTVPGGSPGDRWRVLSIPVTGGTVVVGEDVSSVYSTLRQLTGVDLVVSIATLFVLAIAGFAVVRANLRALDDIEATAGEIAEGHLNRRVPERDPRTEVGSLGRSLNTMLSQIETAFHAQEESEAAARRAEERMRRFIADASHELRTPLTAIRGFAEYYRQRGGMVKRWGKQEAEGEAPSREGMVTTATGLTPSDLDRLMGRVEKEAARMGLLVEDLLLLARLDQQRPLARQPVDLLSLAADAVHDARVLAPRRTIELSVAPGAAYLVIGDEPRLRQVIGNLMSNALTHTPDGTPIEVSISSGVLNPSKGDPTPAVLLDVTDHGPGMSPEQAERVFERFYRTDRARTRATGGSGLGLAIVNALVTAQGGVASVRTAEGKGATFRIALPLAPEAMGGQHPDDDPDQPYPDDGPGQPYPDDDLGQPGATDEPDVIGDTDTVSRRA